LAAHEPSLADVQEAADPERPGMVDRAVGDSVGANLDVGDVGEEVDLPHLATGPQGVPVAPHHQIPLREKESSLMRLLFGLL